MYMGGADWVEVFSDMFFAGQLVVSVRVAEDQAKEMKNNQEQGDCGHWRDFNDGDGKVLT